MFWSLKLYCQTDSCSFIYGKQSSILIFSGTVVKTRIAHIDGEKLEARFIVDTIYKGEATKNLSVYTSTNTTLNYSEYPCYLNGYDFKEGRRYIVYVCNNTQDCNITNKCTFTSELKITEIPILKNDFNSLKNIKE